MFRTRSWTSLNNNHNNTRVDTTPAGAVAAAAAAVAETTKGATIKAVEVAVVVAEVAAAARIWAVDIITTRLLVDIADRGVVVACAAAEEVEPCPVFPRFHFEFRFRSAAARLRRFDVTTVFPFFFLSISCFFTTLDHLFLFFLA